VRFIEEGPVEAGEAFLADLQGELLLHLQLALPSEPAGDEVARAGADGPVL
jgi:hypothetical protein